MLLEKWYFVSLYSLYLALICFSQKLAKGGDCWVFVLAALLLKQISLFQFHMISIPRTLFAEPRSFISNLPFNFFLSFLISSLLELGSRYHLHIEGSE